MIQALLLVLALTQIVDGKILSTSSYLDSEGKEYRTLLTQAVLNPLSSVCDSTVTSHAGYFTVDATTQKNFFYWMFESRRNPATDPLVMWLSGGPGCSSVWALLVEHGPCLFANAEATAPTFNPYSWNANANIIYLEQPSATGFSTSSQAGYATSETIISNDIYTFLIDFLQAFPQYQKNPFFLTGESYAGHYIGPAAARILTGNSNPQAPFKINLQGIAIGNGLVNSLLQFPQYAEYLLNFSGTKLSEPIITTDTYNQMVADVSANCIPLLQSCQTDSTTCATAHDTCDNTVFAYYPSTLSVYNIQHLATDFGDSDPTPNVHTFMNSPAVKQAFGVSSGFTWYECSLDGDNGYAYNLLRADSATSMDTYIPGLLAANINVLIFSGDLDFTCNFYGGKAWVTALQWPGSQQFNAAADNPWMVNEVEKGKLRIYENLAFLQVYDAGHMIPIQQPLAASALQQRLFTWSLATDTPVITGTTSPSVASSTTMPSVSNPTLLSTSTIPGSKTNPGTSSSGGGPAVTSSVISGAAGNSSNIGASSSNGNNPANASGWSNRLIIGISVAAVLVVAIAAFVIFKWSNRLKRAGNIHKNGARQAELSRV